MKRKFKLISSIASLTTAIALLAFGVFAAATRQVDVSGTITFASSNIAATINVYEAYGENEDSNLNYGTSLQTFTYTVNGNVGSQLLKSYTGLGSEGLSEDQMLYSYMVEITNDFSSDWAIIIKYTVNEVEEGDDDWVSDWNQSDMMNVTVNSESNKSDYVQFFDYSAEDGFTLAPGLTVRFYKTYHVDLSEASNLETLAIGASFTLDKTAAGE
jgi:hypothetical protein